MKGMYLKKIVIGALACAVGLSIGLGVVTHTVGAQESADELQKKISDSKQQLAGIEEKIKKLESELNVVGADKKTLQNAIYQLDLSRDKVNADIRATENKISLTDLEIEELEREIYIKEIEVQKNKDAVAESFRQVDQTENQTLVEVVLGYDSIAEVWDALEEQSLLQDSLRESTKILSALKSEYEKAKNASLQKRGQLGELKKELSGQESSLKSTINQKDELLGATKNKEANYQQMLADTKKEKERFEREMREYEEKLKFILDPSKIPVAGSGVLRWPFEPTYIAECATFLGTLGNNFCITQFFGNTSFAQKSGYYTGSNHGGIDFRSPIGTRLNAALAGTVIETNTLTGRDCQYGIWVLIKHGNGLTTLYAHLSSISVVKGQEVSTGQLIGYSGNTGLSTGPHLHFGVYVSDAVQFKMYTCSSGPTVNVPVSAFNGYLNPLNYL